MGTRESIRIAFAQFNATVGDLEGNTSKILHFIEEAKSIGADIVAFPELAVTGYPPEDLLLKTSFVRDALEHMDVIRRTTGIVAVVGFVDQAGTGELYNAAAVIADGKQVGVHHKVHLPNYGVFDEQRYFRPGQRISVFDFGGVTFGVEICEDSWYADGPHQIQSLVGGAELIIVINASPFHAGKWQAREEMIATRATDNTCFFVYGNLVGGQDELVFDGHSMIVAPDGRVIARGPSFDEALVVADLDITEVTRRRLGDSAFREAKDTACVRSEAVHRVVIPGSPGDVEKPVISPSLCAVPSEMEEVYSALMLGTRDYVEKNGFEKVVLGLSGGIDSALTAVIAADALGADRVVGVVMPSQYSSDATQSDAVKLAEALGIAYYRIPINHIFDCYLSTLADAFRGTQPGIAEENIQARIRGNILMALSNKFGWLVLTTGNKSEIAVGYSTLYGDMAGGFNPLKDVPKTLVYKLADYRNALQQVIPQSIIERAPSAELRPGQKDVDTLPPYEVLDPIIHAYIEEDRSVEDIVAMGFDRHTVERVVRMSDRNEYKRRQAPPGVKITPKAFGKDRRLPITNRYRE